MSGDQDQELGRVVLTRQGPVAHILFDRPKARNAMTWLMYKQLDEICVALAKEADLRAVVLRGAGGQAFIAGSDISQFVAFEGAQDGLDYERKMTNYLDNIRAIPVPTIAVIEGWAVGGGLNIAGTCDMRIATSGSKFGSPIARTIGNCMSMQNYAHMIAGFGEARSKRMLLLGEMLGAEEALASGFLARLIEPGELDDVVSEMLKRIVENAPITLRVSKEAIARIMASALPDGDDLMAQCYASADFKIGVSAFIKKEKPAWTGR